MSGDWLRPGLMVSRDGGPWLIGEPDGTPRLATPEELSRVGARLTVDYTTTTPTVMRGQ